MHTYSLLKQPEIRILDRLQAMLVFTRIVELGSFSKAADSLDLPNASATTIIKNLEQHLRVRLLQRTTRRLSLTPEGAEYYERCIHLLAEIEETESSLSDAGRRPKGKLRINIPGSFGRTLVMPHLKKFREMYPDIELMVSFGDKPIDMIRDGIDCAICIGPLRDTSLVARRIGLLETVTAASSEYLAHHGVPQTIEDLDKHLGVHYFSSRTGRIRNLTFTENNQVVEVRMRGALSVSDAQAYVACGLDGVGLIQSPHFMVLPYLQSYELCEVLTKCRPPPTPVCVVWPQNRHLSSRVRVFVEWIVKLFEASPLTGEVGKQQPISTNGFESSRQRSKQETMTPQPLHDAIV